MNAVLGLKELISNVVSLNDLLGSIIAQMVVTPSSATEGRPVILKFFPPVWNLRAVCLIPLFYIYFLSYSSALVLSLFLSYPFLLLAHFWFFFTGIFSHHLSLLICLCLCSDNRRGTCWLNIINGQCENNIQSAVTRSECCGSIGKAWGSPCVPCPSESEFWVWGLHAYVCLCLIILKKKWIFFKAQILDSSKRLTKNNMTVR